MLTASWGKPECAFRAIFEAFVAVKNAKEM